MPPGRALAQTNGKGKDLHVPVKVIVVGGGIGGLTVAIALRRAGLEVVVFERAEGLQEIGAGLLLAANAQKALGKLGLEEAVVSLGTPASAGEIRSWRGEVLASIPAQELERRVGAASAAVHRADLQALLLRELGEGPLRLGSEVEGFAQDEAGVTVLLAGGSEERADLLVGADGLNSRIRNKLFGSEELRYAGYTAWRAVAKPEQEILPWGTGFESWGRGGRFGCAHIGKGRVYWFATRNSAEGGKDGPPGSPTGTRTALLQYFGEWHHPVRELIEATDEEAIRRDDLFDREPLSARWGVGRVTLLGDAAHPITPNLGQGACQAIEDAVVLARCLREVDGVADALRRYEELRAARTARIVRQSRRIGQVGQLENPLLCRLRDRALAMIPLKLQLRQLEEVVGYEV